jgi:PAS domain S-box-containing protein
MLGYDEHDPHVSPDWRRLVHRDDMARVQALIRDHIAGKTPMFESVHRMRHTNGEWRWVVSRAKARVDSTGRLRRLVGVELDITERKLYEDALFKEKESAQITLQSIGDGVITTDGHLIIEYLNPVAEELTGWRFEEARAGTSTTSSAVSTRRPASRSRIRCRSRSGAAARSSRCGRRC